MNHFLNRFLCIILSISMIISLVSVRPVTANADDNSPSNDFIYDNNADSLPSGEESVLDSGEMKQTVSGYQKQSRKTAPVPL